LLRVIQGRSDGQDLRLSEGGVVPKAKEVGIDSTRLRNVIWFGRVIHTYGL
jgi:hypothetical protein